jgi:hypothetical protein
MVMAASMVPAASFRNASTCVTAAIGVFETGSAGTTGVAVTDETVAPISVRRMTSPEASAVGLGPAAAGMVPDVDVGPLPTAATAVGADDVFSCGVPSEGVGR